MKKNYKTSKRSLSRLMAVQIFYQNDFSNKVLLNNKNPQEFKEYLIENYLLKHEEGISSYREKIDESFLNILIESLIIHAKQVDDDIEKFLQKDWNLEKLDQVMLQIIRCGAIELKMMKDIPTNVIIGEYVDISASFFPEKKVTFVNAILDKMAKNLYRA